jgi:hypothetical protein
MRCKTCRDGTGHYRRNPWLNTNRAGKRAEAVMAAGGSALVWSLALTGRANGGRMTGGVVMRWLRRTSLSVCVWLTAAMTVAAGVPHTTCGCPDGGVKSPCFGPPAQNYGCCCGGECCGQKAQTSCCEKSNSDSESAGCRGHHAKLAPKVAAKTERAFTATGCKRTLVQPEAATPPRLEKPVLTDVTVGTFLGSVHAPVWDGPSTPCGFRREHQRPPPTDLLTALQRLLI